MAELDKKALTEDRTALATFNSTVVEEFRANKGVVGGPLAGGQHLLLHTTGAKSGQVRLSPLAYLSIGGTILVIGANGGLPKDPSWAHNLRAHPRALVEIGGDTYPVDARELKGGEREAVAAQIAASSPEFAAFQADAGRRIPLFELIRVC